MDDDHYYLDADDVPEFSLEPLSLAEAADLFCHTAAEMTPEQRACIRQAVAWELLHQCEWTPGDLEFLAEAGIRP
jgi:hypothetical protein